jgi:tetraacyldisaccharide 4'-kinase
MKFIRKILFPFALVYGLIVSIRNLCYDNGWFKSNKFSIPVIAVGNLSVGGTGKTPQIEYLIRLLSHQYAVATLSRGYKRKTKGFVLANQTSDVASLGDEPLQYFKKFDNIQVAVDEKRSHGIKQLLEINPKIEVVLLDDAFQHRAVQAGFYILLTSYTDLYTNDFIIPMGNLRESRAGAKRANCIVVTKCPADLSTDEKVTIISKLKVSNNQKVFFTTIQYDDSIFSETNSLEVATLIEPTFLVAGIANPKPFYQFLNAQPHDCLTFSDHHLFSEKDIQEINTKAKDRIIITTEKDYVRLKPLLKTDKLYYLPIKTYFLDNEIKFKQAILDYIQFSN